MSTALQAVAESKPPFRGSNPAVLVTLPAEVRLAIYGFLFRKRVAMMRNGVASNREARRSNLTYRGGKGGKTKLIKIDETQDQMTRTERSSQLLRVCRSIHDEALPVLYDDTLFYLYGGAHIVSLHTLAHNESVRTIVLRLDVEETDDYLDFESQMRPLSSEVITFPNLKSLQIKIKLHTFSYRSDRRKMDASFIRIDTLFSMLRVVTPQNQPRSFFEDETKKGSEIAFRMVIGDAERQERENIVDMEAIIPEVEDNARILREFRGPGEAKTNHRVERYGQELLKLGSLGRSDQMVQGPEVHADIRSHD